MRAPLPFALALAALAPTVVRAEPAKPPAPDRGKLLLLHDGKNHYLAVTPYESTNDRLFYGDGKRFFAVPVQSGGSEEGKRFGYTFSDPRYYVRFTQNTSIDYKDGKYSVSCGERETPLTLVDDKTAKPLLEKATFVPSPRKRRPYALARDTTGKYYFVDTGRTPETAKDFHLYVGPKGGLKLQKMTNVVSDSEGDIFSTKTGSLRLILSKSESSWVKEEKPTKLLLVPSDDNVAMIYNELGVYSGERLGTPCDDL